VTLTASPPAPAGRRMLRPGTGLFTFTLAMGMAVMALGVDTMLPAFPEIRDAMGLAADSNETAGLITFFLLGSSVGLLPAGLLADRFGRRPIMVGGLALYVVGAVLAVFAPSLTLMFIGRFIWGLGASGPRVAVMAMVRDATSGEDMARQMSFIMAIFILVPTFAPALSAGLLAIGPWQIIFWLCAAAGAGMIFATLRLPETLHNEDRIPLSARGVFESCKTVLTTPGTLGYVASLTALFGVFLSYIASSEIIVDEVFGLEAWFPVIFGGVALVMGLSMFFSGKIVHSVGLDRLIARAFMVSIPVVAVLLITALATDGRPPFWLFMLVLCPVLFVQQILIPNLNTAGMQPLAEVAGTGAAILGMVPGAVGSMIGYVIDKQFDGSIKPMCIAFGIGQVASLAAWWWARSATRDVALATA
jgi:DHA1 family bicyclomycin/chloramphenicol resistance-like MFS transporter